MTATTSTDATFLSLWYKKIAVKQYDFHSRISHHLSFKLLSNLYYLIIYPHLIYCIKVWDRTVSTRVERVLRIQKRAVKVITLHGVDHHAATNQFMNMNSIYNYFASNKLFKILKEHNHIYFSNRMLDVQVDHEHVTRFRSNRCLVAPFFRKTTCQHAFGYQCVIIWNRFPINLKNCVLFPELRRMLKRYLTTQQEPILRQ